MKNSLCFLVIFFSLFSVEAQAKQNPVGLATDSRIKVVRYDPNNVVEVNTSYGYATTVVLEEGEFITLDGGMGKKAGWDIASKPYSNFVIIKPKLLGNETNLNFQTNKNRIYSFNLRAAQQSMSPTFMVRFEYNHAFKNSPFASRVDAYNVMRGFGNPERLNDAYSFVGDQAIAPIVAQDNGTFTRLRFKRGAPIPAIMAVDPSTRKESLVNFRVQHGYVVVEGVFTQYTLRYGAHVTCLFNDRAIAEHYGHTRGAKPHLKRVAYSKPTKTVRSQGMK